MITRIVYMSGCEISINQLITSLSSRLPLSFPTFSTKKGMDKEDYEHKYQISIIIIMVRTHLQLVKISCYFKIKNQPIQVYINCVPDLHYK